MPYTTGGLCHPQRSQFALRTSTGWKKAQLENTLKAYQHALWHAYILQGTGSSHRSR